jgi:hypothetical protein
MLCPFALFPTAFSNTFSLKFVFSISTVSHAHLVKAAKNPICGREILQSLLKRVPKLRSSLDDDVLVAAARNSDLEPMRVFGSFDEVCMVPI